VRVGFDYRPALLNREGIGRYARELVRGFLDLEFGTHLGLFAYSLAGSKFSRRELGLDGKRAELVRLRIPSRWMPGLLRRLGKGVDDLVGGCDVYHHTNPHVLHVRRAAEVATIFDTIYTLDAQADGAEGGGAGYLSREAAQKMTASAKELVSRVKTVIVPSEFVGAEVVMTFGVPPERVAIAHLGCDHVARDLPPEGYARPAEPYLLTVSRVDARKNHLRMLEAFERIVKEGFPHRWVIAGPPGHGAEVFERALAESPARGRVEWRRFVADTELPKLYSQADLFLFASLNEGFGLPPLEAMACGVPVVASCVTSMPEVLGDAAFLVEPTESERIFEAARRMLAEPEIGREFAEKGKRRAREFTWRECARRTLLAYREATKAENPG
jgi:glycosyltransferase involved in cell wall biosynthesis